jgi:Uncharacterized protein conserved in archaea
MSTVAKNKEYGDKFKELLGLRHEPVAVRLMRKNDKTNLPLAEKQLSHCQAVSEARSGKMFMMPADLHGCNVGASALGIVETPDKVRSGEFHFAIGAHETQGATEKMIADRTALKKGATGTAYAPLSKADFEPDVVIVEDIPERVYWFMAMSTAEKGGRASYSTAPFQAACVDTTAIPIETGRPNISIGCFGCRKRTDIKADEMLIGIPYKLIPEMSKTLEMYKDGILTKAKRD